MIKFMYFESTIGGSAKVELYVNPSEVTHVKTSEESIVIYTKNKEVTFVIPTNEYNVKAVKSLLDAIRELNEKDIF